MMDIDEKTKCFQDAFVLARTDQQLTKANIEVFKKLRGFFADDIVDKIDNFQPGRKGILLIGDDFDLLDGIVSYIWYKHPLIYPMSGNEVTGNALRSCLAYKNAAGHKEHAISDLLFSKNLLSHMHGGILFLKNINPTYTDLLERIIGTLQDVNCRPLIQEKRSSIIRHSSIFVEDGIGDFDDPEIQRREERPKFKRMPGILVMSVKKRLPEAFRRQFQEIPVDGEEERQEGRKLSKSLEYIRWDDDKEKFYAKAKGRETEKELKLSGQPYKILNCLYNASDPASKKTSVPIDTVLHGAEIKKHKKGDNISEDKRVHLHTRITLIKDELEDAGFNRDCIRVIGDNCELHIKLIDDFDDV